MYVDEQLGQVVVETAQGDITTPEDVLTSATLSSSPRYARSISVSTGGKTSPASVNKSNYVKKWSPSHRELAAGTIYHLRGKYSTDINNCTTNAQMWGLGNLYMLTALHCLTDQGHRDLFNGTTTAGSPVVTGIAAYSYPLDGPNPNLIFSEDDQVVRNAVFPKNTVITQVTYAPGTSTVTSLTLSNNALLTKSSVTIEKREEITEFGSGVFSGVPLHKSVNSANNPILDSPATEDPEFDFAAIPIRKELRSWTLYKYSGKHHGHNSDHSLLWTGYQTRQPAANQIVCYSGRNTVKNLGYRHGEVCGKVTRWSAAYEPSDLRDSHRPWWSPKYVYGPLTFNYRAALAICDGDSGGPVYIPNVRGNSGSTARLVGIMEAFPWDKNDSSHMDLQHPDKWLGTGGGNIKCSKRVVTNGHAHLVRGSVFIPVSRVMGRGWFDGSMLNLLGTHTTE